MKTWLPDILGSLIVLLAHTLLSDFLLLGDIAPDLLLVWIVYLALRRGQVTGTVAGFFLGLVLDLLAGPDGMLGLAALAKTTAGFVAGFFYSENKTLQILGGYQFVVITALTSGVHNLLYFVIFLQGTGLSLPAILLRYGLTTTLYTAAAGLIPMFVFARRLGTQG